MPFVYGVENTGADYPVPTLPSMNQLPTIEALPDPFAWADGRGRISTFSDWKYRRAEIGAQIQNYEIGVKPVRPDSIQASYSGGILTVIVSLNGKTLTLTSQVILPTGTGPFPAVIGMNSQSGSIPSTIFSSRNIAQITFSHNQVTAYNNPQNTDPYYRLYGPALNVDNTGQYSAWAWGVSRIIDGLELVQNVLPINLGQIAVTGCSYAGKMALFAGAFDERIALTIAQESGGGGATSWRYSQTEPSGSVETIGATSHQWFSEDMFQFYGTNVSKLPEDHHELMAMCAPRALFVTANPDYTWLSNPSCDVCSRACARVYNALGIFDRFAYSIVGGHLHCQVPGIQIPELEAFVDKYLLGIDNGFTYYADSPYGIDISAWIKWTTPTLTNDTSLIAWASLRYPSDFQMGLDTTVTFRWNKVQNVTQYLIQVSMDSTFAILDKSDSTSTDTLKTFTGLSRGKKYYWRVKVQSVAGVGLWSNKRTFFTTTSSLAKPQLRGAAPVQGQPGYATYTWSKVPDADQYSIQVSAAQTFNRMFRTGSTADTVITFSGHSNGQTYYWQVQGSNIAGSGPWSDLAIFTTPLTDVKKEAGIPAEYSLHQNYPNPFNPATKIDFALPHTAQTTITVYDLLGRTVQTLIDKRLEAGYHEIAFDGGNYKSGIYFYRIESGPFVQTKKMVFMR